jgi:hypothetical protein
MPGAPYPLTPKEVMTYRSSARWYGTPLKNMFSGANVTDWDTDTSKAPLVRLAELRELSERR